MFWITFVLLLGLSRGIDTDENITNVGVFLNKVSSCNYNHLTANLLCANQEYNTLIQYHNVDKVYMCDYHYCVTFFDEPNKFSCSGYVFKLLGGNMNTYLNPLTPNPNLDEYHVNKDNVRQIGKVFEGYNVLIDRFEQNVQTEHSEFGSLKCENPYSTCIIHKNGSKNCFGAYNMTFHGQSSSLMFGVIIPGILATIMYLFAFIVTKKFCIGNYFCIMLGVPVFVTVCSYLILFEAEHFIVKTYVYLIGSIFGIIFGYVIANALVRIRGYFKVSKVDDDQDAGEEDKFIIEGSDDEENVDVENLQKKDGSGTITEIELSQSTVRI